MALRALIVVALLAATPALAQDASSSTPSASTPSSSAMDISSSSAPDSSSSAEPAPPTGLSDADLELVVRAAYTGASAFANAHDRYFARDGVLPPLHDAVAAEVAKEGFGSVTVPPLGSPELGADGIKACLASPGTELRLVANTYGDGLTLVAVTDSRDFAYSYDPHKAADIVVTKAEPCTKAP